MIVEEVRVIHKGRRVPCAGARWLGAKECCMSVGERAMHAAIVERWASGSGWRGVLVGPGDDAAVVEGGGGVRWLVTTDQAVSGRHFDRDTATERVGYKAIARSVSDIAAMAGEPRYSVVTALVPATYGEEWHELYDALDTAARQLGCPLVGGDIASHDSDQLVLTATVIGEAHGERGAVLRSGARVGDGVYVTGDIGGAYVDREDGRGEGHLSFEPRVRAAWVLADMLGRRLHAMIDVSDGLGLDASRVGHASGVTLEIDVSSVPLAPGVAEWREALGAGEDYELVFTTEASSDEVESVGETVGVPMTRIGTVVPMAGGEGGAVLVDGGVSEDASTYGFEH